MEHERLQNQTVRQENFEALYRVYSERTRRYIERFFRSSHQVDDVFQDAWLLIALRSGEVLDPASMEGWIFRLVRNQCLNASRGARRRPVLSESELDAVPTASSLESDAISREELISLALAFQSMKPSDQDILRKISFEDASVQELAVHLRISPENVRKRISRARTTLREEMQWRPKPDRAELALLLAGALAAFGYAFFFIQRCVELFS